MNIPYTYEVISATEQGLILLYKSPGYPDTQVGTPVPKINESLDAIAQQYAPVAYWLDLTATRIVPVVGTTGVYTPVADTPVENLTAAQLDALRMAAYQTEADPLFFKWQRGEATQAEWLAKVAEIKARY